MGNETCYGDSLMELQKYVRMRLVDFKYFVEQCIHVSRFLWKSKVYQLLQACNSICRHSVEAVIIFGLGHCFYYLICSILLSKGI